MAKKKRKKRKRTGKPMKLGEIRCYGGRKLKKFSTGARFIKGGCSGTKGQIIKAGR